MEPVLLILGIGGQELAFLIFLAFLLFGATKIPDLARALGRAQGEFSKAKKQFEREVKDEERRGEDERDLRERARKLGIDVAGKTDEELRVLVRERESPEYASG